jgi:hypothetical protein
MLAAGLVIGLVPLRNQIVAGKPALTASSGGVNLQKLHRPSKQVRLAGADDDPLYNALGLDRPTRAVLEYARQEPLEYVRSYLPLAAYSLGFGFALNDLVDEQPVQLHPGLIGLDLLYLTALVAVPVARGTGAGLLHAYVAVHLLTMVVFAPYDYENRLVTPMYILVAVVGGGLLGQLARLLRAEAAEHRQVAPSSVAAAGR